MIYFLQKKLPLLFALVFLSVVPSFAQDDFEPPSFHFEIFNLPGGPLGNHCQAVVQDSFGYMWFGTQGGLHRWDGYEFKTYRSDPKNPNSISYSYVEYIYVAKNGDLWLGTWGGGLNHFDHETEKFTSYNHDPNDESSLSNKFVAAIAEDDDGNIWAGTQDGVNRLDIKTKEIKRFLHDPKDSTSLSYAVCRKIYKDSDGVMWFGTGWAWEPFQRGGLNRYNPETENFTRYFHDPNDKNSLFSSKVFDIFEDSKNNFWIATAGDGLHLMDRKTGKFTRLENDPNRDDELSTPLRNDLTDYHTKFIYEDQNQNIWIGAWGGGIKYYNPKSGYVHHYYDDGKTTSIPDNYAWRMFQSNDGTLWGTTCENNAKVFKIIKQSEAFKFNRIGFAGDLMDYCETKNGDEWYSSIASGLLNVSNVSRDTIQYLINTKNPGVLYRKNTFHTRDIWVQNFSHENMLFRDIASIIEDNDGWLWLAKNSYMGVSDTSLIRFNPSNGAIKYYKHDPKDENSIGFGYIHDLVKDKAGNIWLTSEEGELNLFNEKENNFTRYPFLNEQEVEKGVTTHIWSVVSLNHDGNLLIAHISHNASNKVAYLDQFDPVNKKLIAEPIILPSKYNDLNQFVYGIQQDAKGNVWVATISRLHRVDLISGEVKSFDPEEFETTDFKGITMDDQNRLWLSCSNALIVYNPDNGYRYNYKKGVVIPEFPSMRKAIFKKSDGTIMVGSKSGMFRFDPKKIKEERISKKPKVIISDFQLMQNLEGEVQKNRITLQDLKSGAINLTYDQNVFSIRFAALDFHDPKNNQNEFLLENYDHDWRKAGAEPLATYVKVPPGEYTFRVRATSSKGVLSDEKTLQIIISPPWWQTWWAQATFYLSLILLIFGGYQYQLNRRLDQAEAHRLKELDTVKTQLYTNITHEFRTPLTVISGMTKQIKENPKEWFSEGLDMIQRNGDRLLNLVNQMLDLSKLESGKMALNLKQSDIISYIKYLVESFHSYAEKENIQLHFLSETKELIMDYDAEKIQQVITNLLSNAVKFTPKDGHIYLSIREEQQLGNKYVLIKVKDTGIGIPEEKIEQIFDRFYQIDDSSTRQSEGSGIGLALTHDLIKLMNGTISVTSEKGTGTEFTISLPIQNEAEIHTQAAVLSKPLIHDSNSLFKKNRAPEIENGNSGDSSKSEILLIEDNPDVVAYVASILEKNYQIKVGKDGQEGIEMALENIPDLIISDVMMPYKDGFEVCDILKNDERTSHIPIIMLTAKADIESKIEGLQKGADAYLKKPFDKTELLVRIEKLLDLRKKLQLHYRNVLGSPIENSIENDTPETVISGDYFVKKVRKVIEENMDNFDLSVEMLCKEIGMSNSQLHRKLSALTGLSASKFIRYIRLNHAKELLSNQELTITAVAFDTGFNDPSYFGRVFKKEFGLTPMEWREKVEQV